MKKAIIVLALAAFVALPGAAYAGQYFTGLMGPGGSATSGSYTSWSQSQIDGTYVAGRTYRVGYAIACCGGSSYYDGTDYIANSNIVYYKSVSSAKGHCGRSSAGSGSSTITCRTD